MQNKSGLAFEWDIQLFICMFKLLNLMFILKNLGIKSKHNRYMLAQINDGCAICRLIAQCVDPQNELCDRQIPQIHRLHLTSCPVSRVPSFTAMLAGGGGLCCDILCP